MSLIDRDYMDRDRVKTSVEREREQLKQDVAQILKHVSKKKKLVLALEGKVRSVYAVATTILAKEYRPKKKARKKR